MTKNEIIYAMEVLAKLFTSIADDPNSDDLKAIIRAKIKELIKRL